MTENSHPEHDLPESKVQARHRLLTLRKSMSADERQIAAAAISKKVRAWLAGRLPGLLGVYWPIRNEPDLRALYSQLAAEGLELALPVMIDRASPLKFAAWVQNGELDIDQWGIATPRHLKFVSPSALLIPCVGFNQARFRLGYGGGFYDRTLAVAPRPVAIGIAYADTTANFPVDPYDIPLDAVITQQ